MEPSLWLRREELDVENRLGKRQSVKPIERHAVTGHQINSFERLRRQPLALVVLPMLPEKMQRDRWLWLAAAILVGIPTLISVVLAMRAEQLDFGGH